MGRRSIAWNRGRPGPGHPERPTPAPVIPTARPRPPPGERGGTPAQHEPLLTQLAGHPMAAGSPSWQPVTTRNPRTDCG